MTEKINSFYFSEDLIRNVYESGDLFVYFLGDLNEFFNNKPGENELIKMLMCKDGFSVKGYDKFLGYAKFKEDELTKDLDKILIGKTNDNPNLKGLNEKILKQILLGTNYASGVYANSTKSSLISLGNHREVRLIPPLFEYASGYYRRPSNEKEVNNYLKLFGEEMDLCSKVIWFVAEGLKKFLTNEEIKLNGSKNSFE